MGWFSKPFYLLSTFLFHATHWMGGKFLSACFVFAAISRLKHSQISAFISARFWHWECLVFGFGNLACLVFLSPCGSSGKYTQCGTPKAMEESTSTPCSPIFQNHKLSLNE